MKVRFRTPLSVKERLDRLPRMGARGRRAKRWAEQISEDVYEFQKTEFPWLESGIKVWFSPVQYEPELAIISLNPGGGKEEYEEEGDKHRFEHGDFSTPKENLYFKAPESWKQKRNMAPRMQDFFKSSMSTLQDSVAFPVIFFRSSNYKELKATDPSREIESFCLSKIKEILEVLKPRKLLVLGFTTFYIMQRHLGDFTKERDIKGERSRVAFECEWKGVPVFVLKHPTGARISRVDWELARRMYFT